MCRASIFAVILFFSLVFCLPSLAKTNKNPQAKVLLWGKNPDTGQVVLILSFSPNEWRKFVSLFGRPRPGKNLNLEPVR